MKNGMQTHWTKRLAFFASGAVLLQTGGCTFDTELLLGQLADYAFQALLSSLII